jgi:hypothetical protein
MKDEVIEYLFSVESLCRYRLDIETCFIEYIRELPEKSSFVMKSEIYCYAYAIDLHTRPASGDTTGK